MFTNSVLCFRLINGNEKTTDIDALCSISYWMLKQVPVLLSYWQRHMQLSTLICSAHTIDFNPGFIQPSSSCSSTTAQTNPWWRVDLHYIYRVSSVVITNRLDCCPERINGAEIRIGNSLENNGNNNPICAVISSIPAGVSSTYICNDMNGRYVNLFIPGDSRFLTLCEVEVYGEGNLATGRTVTQSSTFGTWVGEQAIDLNPSFIQPSSSCSSTDIQTNPWWRVDLHYIYRVSSVVITNRLDCCPERINGAEIRIGNSLENNGNNNPICAVISSIPAGVSSTYICNDMDGRYVNLFLPGDSRFLTLCEVEVYGEGVIKQTDLVFWETINGFIYFFLNLQSALMERGFSDVMLQWSQPPTKEAMRKEDSPAQCAVRKR
uniref:Fucolectin tachylectin-4 pentraxin-1 domain-containing protein n=1 Tax=Cyprinus carpio TaxID=7962 RepID=A0A8C2A2H5_CYPCA